MDMMEIILRIVDDSRIEQFKPSFGKGMITGWAHIHGNPHGVHYARTSINSGQAI
jgi:acetyl-CoA carboxylase carboxyltransferase component